MTGRIALGLTSDQRVTPFDEIAPGGDPPRDHATFVENMLRGELLERVAEIALVLRVSSRSALEMKTSEPAHETG